MTKRCKWVTADPLYIDYHDSEWGVPEYNDQRLFESLLLEGLQAGLSWLTILKKRQTFYDAFDQFDPEKIVAYGARKKQQLMNNAAIIRNRLKIESIVSNAQAYLQLTEQQSLSDWLWAFVDGKPIVNAWENQQQVPTQTELSMQLSKELKKLGFRFVGPTICYAFMQAVGMVQDHTTDCFRYRQLL
jgi:DNA-3-methyladenine glycosylase I